MACTGCFDGCTEVSSSNCQKYTGPNIPELDIESGSSITVVIEKITEKIISIVSGEGIIPDIDISTVCKVVKDNLPSEGDINLVDYLKALIATACSLDERINQVAQSVQQIDSAYDVCCLTDVDANSKTHQVLQAVIKKVCSVSQALTEFMLDVTTNYVKIDTIDDYIAEYLAENTDFNSYSARMVPYAPIPYFGPISGPNFSFDISGKGTGLFDKVYFCNGQNGTPDLRGFGLAGVTTGMGGSTLDPLVNPATVGNPAYTLNAANGSNTTTLTSAQIPSHSHTATSSATSDPHYHHLAKAGPRSDINSIYAIDSYSDTNNNAEYELRGTPGSADLFRSSSTSITVNVSTTVADTGGGQAHSNVQPTKGCYFIIYIP